MYLKYTLIPLTTAMLSISAAWGYDENLYLHGAMISATTNGDRLIQKNTRDSWGINQAEKLDSIWKLGAGYQIDQTFALETSYMSFSNSSNNRYTDQTPEGTSLTVMGVSRFPFDANKTFYGFLKGGVSYNEVQQYTDNFEYSAGIGPAVSAGASYMVRPGMHMVTEYFISGTDENTLQGVFTGIQFNY